MVDRRADRRGGGSRWRSWPRLFLPLLGAGTVAVGGICLQAPPASALPETGWLRVGNFSAKAPALDVYIDGKKSAGNVVFEQVIPYAAVAAGPHTVALLSTRAASPTPPLTPPRPP